jgi:hypothetical protein
MAPYFFLQSWKLLTCWSPFTGRGLHSDVISGRDDDDDDDDDDILNSCSVDIIDNPRMFYDLIGLVTIQATIIRPLSAV